MKKLFAALVLGIALMFNPVANANEYVPDTDAISAENELVIIDEGYDNAHAVWVSHNPTCYNKQELKTGTWECFIDVDAEVTYVYHNGELVKEIKL